MWEFRRRRPPPPTEATDQRLTLIFEQAVRALSQQIAAVDALRTRAGTVVAAASLASSFLGATALREQHLPTPVVVSSVLALTSLSIVVGATMRILWPQDWRTGFNAQDAIQTYIDTPPFFGIDQVRRDLALQLQIDTTHNEAQLNKLYKVFQYSIGALAAEVLFWLLALALR